MIPNKSGWSAFAAFTIMGAGLIVGCGGSRTHAASHAITGKGGNDMHGSIRVAGARAPTRLQAGLARECMKRHGFQRVSHPPTVHQEQHGDTGMLRGGLRAA
jgi:hypothetical protein